MAAMPQPNEGKTSHTKKKKEKIEDKAREKTAINAQHAESSK